MVLSRTTLSSSETKANSSNAHLACFKCAEFFSRITSTGVLKQTAILYFTLGFRNHTAGLINYLPNLTTNPGARPQNPPQDRQRVEKRGRAQEGKGAGADAAALRRLLGRRREAHG